ncbi:MULTISPECIES: cyclic lactone autoinducer peptide [Enterococcus]|uniref:Cyclic lactone autoinducer peptide n=1 Tax=Enterococcus faecium TaxID=1352 RepID=A0A242B0F6_ENTFC|nr:MULTISPECIES: cyclic lactone autoinducer peptide [Enterococcus]MCR1928442.1 cyclic lactone autoinducer peptide [Enterococcus gallinarum]MCR1930291.1 cyclic lactone autoinducer peptide [Enterococcus gallinarum]MCR1945446.1 cyclic lactone autoinducer peptide [Enterococcus gallinarum]OTN86799.1 hypothetical protein A5810_002922 [Enterococcus faecium]OTN95226.1 hypothetical protein A5810_001475 [Enterococcus faecium]
MKNVKQVFYQSIANVGLSLFNQSKKNCCFLATYEPKINNDLKKIAAKEK